MREEFLNIFLFRILELRWSAWHKAKDYFLFSQIKRKEEREERERKKERRKGKRKERRTGRGEKGFQGRHLGKKSCFPI